MARLVVGGSGYVGGMRFTKPKTHPNVVKKLKVALEVLHHFTRLEQLPELTVVQINILNLLDRVRPTRPSQLASARGVSRSAVSHALKRLHAAKLIVREPDPEDGRFVHVLLTEAGEQLKLWPSMVDEERVEEMADHLSLVQHQGVQRALDNAGKAAAGCDFRVNNTLDKSLKGLLAGPGVWPDEGPGWRPPFIEKPPRSAIRAGPRPGPKRKPKKAAETPGQSSPQAESGPQAEEDPPSTCVPQRMADEGQGTPGEKRPGGREPGEKRPGEKKPGEEGRPT